MHLLGKNALARQVAGVHTRDALDVGREALGQPDVIVPDFRQCEMDHLVHEYPILMQLFGGDVATELQTDEWHGCAVRRAMPDAATIARAHADAQLLRWKLAVVTRHCPH